MKKILLILALGTFTFGYSQVPTRTDSQQLTENVRERNYEMNGVVNYRNGDRKIVFIPNNDGYEVSAEQNGTISTIGKIRKTVSNDGYYILYSTNREPAYGKFDEEGNFNAFRYDPAQDRVVEDHYIKNMSDRDNRTRTNRNIRENMNSEGEIRTPTTRTRAIETPINN